MASRHRHKIDEVGDATGDDDRPCDREADKKVRGGLGTDSVVGAGHGSSFPGPVGPPLFMQLAVWSLGPWVCGVRPPKDRGCLLGGCPRLFARPAFEVQFAEPE